MGSASLIGTIVQDRYRILEFLAEGAMGSVYCAERIGLERKVAIKFLSPTFAANANSSERFEREAKAMSRLDHPNCVSVIDFGVSPVPFIVMEYVTGVTLRETLDQGPISVERALYYCSGILAGLAHAHEQSIVHRDIKPANVMITEAAGTDDLVRLLDFGLAKLRDAAPSDISASWVVLGTPSYMSPEQSHGSNVDWRTDLYATGIVLFELLTGEKPYQAEQAIQTLVLHNESPIPKLSEVAPDRDFPPGLQELINKAMAKKPTERFATAIEFGEAIKALGAQSAVLPPVSTKGKGKGKVEGTDPTVLSDSQIAGSRVTTEVGGARPASPTMRQGLFALVALLVCGAIATAAGIGPFASKSRQGESAKVADEGARTDAAAAVAVAGPEIMGGGEGPELEPGDAEVAIVEANPDQEGSDGDEVGEDDEFGEDEALSPEEIAAEEANVDPPAADAGADDATVSVRNVADARKLAAQGKREAAISGLRQLLRKNPKNAQAAYLLGNLNFEKMWWSEGLVQYGKAIQHNRNYKKNATLVGNVIRALGSTKTRTKSQRFLRQRIGKSALPRLRKAAKKDKSPLVRKGAAQLVRRMTAKKKRPRPRPRPRRR